MKISLLFIALICIALSAVSPSNDQWHDTFEVFESIAVVLTLPARLVINLFFPYAFSNDVPHDQFDLILNHLLWGLMTVAYWYGLQYIFKDSVLLWKKVTFLAMSFPLSAYMVFGLLSHWGCWHADTPCFSAKLYLAHLLGMMVFAMTGLAPLLVKKKRAV